MAVAAIKAFTKWCSGCLANKPLTDFHKDSSRSGGLTGACKGCKKAASREWYKQNRKRVSTILDNPNEKTCVKCGETKSLTSFSVSKTGRLGHESRCKTCRAGAQREWYESHPDYAKQFYLNNREKLNEKRRGKKRRSYPELTARWRERNRPLVMKHKFNYRQLLRMQVLEAYGGRCACCGESTPEFLGVDHIYNDGAKHRKEVGSGSAFYSWLRKRGFPKDGFQLLCHNCNLAKGFYGQCPHARALETRGAA
jgi:hypothetical protein